LGIAGFEAEEAAGLIPTLGAAGVIVGGGAAAAYTAWHITAGIWRQINTQEASTAAVAGWEWRRQSIITPKNSANDTACMAIGYSGGAPCDYYTLEYSTAQANPGTLGNFPNPPPSGAGSALIEFCSSGSDVHCNGASEDINARNFASLLGAVGSNHTGIGTDDDYMIWDNTTFAGPCSSFCDQFIVIRNDMQMVKHSSTPTCDAGCQTTHTTVTDSTGLGFSRPSSGTGVTDTQLTAALCALGIGSGCAAANGAPTTTVHKTEIDILKKSADPTYGFPVAPNCAGLTSSACVAAFSSAGFTATPTVSTASFSGADVAKPPLTVITQSPGALVAADPASTITITVNPADTDMPFAIPRPLVGETYADYISRLQSLGYIGAITYVDLDDTSGDLDLGPSGVPRVGIQIGTNTTTVQVITKSWPIPNPKIKAGSGITVYRNPTDFPAVTPEPTPADPANPPPYEPGSGTPGGGVGGNCGPVVPGVNLNPFTSIDFGGKFPFGIFGWIGDALSPIVAAPSAPVFDIPIFLMGNSYSMHVDLSPANPYMATVRLLMEIGIGIASLVLLASSLLGFRAGNGGGGLTTDASLDDD
jgi:hypothetical protein